ncbi:MAG: diaminopimelate epimerase [Planctomycetota bacterium]|nr:diaminopimelate epimerase [Planctomycetota bacterium]
MRAIPIVKMSGTGNDFVMVDNRDGLLKEAEKSAFVQAVCPRRVSAGADGAILVEPADKPGHDFRMRYYNADGGEAEMCGNGSRCIAVFAYKLGAAGRAQKIQTVAGTLLASVPEDGRSAKVRLSQPGALEIKENVDILGAKRDLYCLNTGVPHAIEFCDDVSRIEIKPRGAAIRYHEVFKPKGANANFVQLLGKNEIRLRTYERGVEDETLACGTGATAAAIITGLVHGYKSPVKVHIASGDALTIHFELQEKTSAPPLLEGAVKTVYKGEFYWA